MKSGIRDYAYSSPLWMAIETALIAVVLFSLPSVVKLGATAEFVLHIVCRAGAAVFAVISVKACDFKLFAKKKISVSEIFIFPGLLIGFNFSHLSSLFLFENNQFLFPS